METWKPLPSYEHLYEVSTDGRVRSRAKGRILSTYAHRKKKKDHGRGYLQVELWNRNTRKKAHVHTLVLNTFVGPRPAGRQCRHLNGISTDNRLENLAWGTGEDNLQDRLKHRPDWYLTAGDKIAILMLPEWSAPALAKEIGCSKTTVKRLRAWAKAPNKELTVDAPALKR